jgi:hypothetical protein
MGTSEIIGILNTAFGEGSNANFCTTDFVYKYGASKGALLYSGLFSPGFTEIDGMIFWDEETAESQVVELFRELNDPKEVEKE